MNLTTLGWNQEWTDTFGAMNEPQRFPARVIQEHREAYVLLSEEGECPAEVSGRFRHQAATRRDFPAVGDWVAAERGDENSPAIIHGVLPRRTAFVRRAGLPGSRRPPPGPRPRPREG